MRSWPAKLAAFCFALALSAAATQAADCGPGDLPQHGDAASCATSAPAPHITVQIRAEPKAAKRCCWPFCTCGKHQYLAPGAPPQGLLVQSMPVLYPQLAYPTPGAPVQLPSQLIPNGLAPPGTPAPGGPARSPSPCDPNVPSPGMQAPGAGGGSSSGLDPAVELRLTELTANVNRLHTNVEGLMKSLEKQVEALQKLQERQSQKQP